ncbi:MAG: YdcF family protein [Acidobacteria bacterium]|nr:YdcF family protein [Acidobacteriota bacterium]
MDFLNRVFKLVLLPGSIQFLIVGLVIGVVLLYGRDRARRLGRYWLTVLATAYLAMSVPVGADVLTAGLARGFSSIASAREADGATAIVVLSGGSHRYSNQGSGVEFVSEASALRALEAARIYHLLSNPLVITSTGLMPERTRSEAALLADALISLGVPAERIIQETRSMSTREHALFVPPLLRKHGVEQFVLVTSPTHIRRAMRAFEAEGLRPVASMSAMRSSKPRRALGGWWPSRENLSISAQAIYDYFGLVYYWSRGWI